MTKPRLVATADQTDTATQPLADLPSEHIQHSSVYEHETKIRMAVFDTGIVALQGEMEGQQEAFETEMETLKTEFERKTAEMTKAHTGKKADLLRRISDMNTGKAMAAAALDKFNELQEQRKEGEAQ